MPGPSSPKLFEALITARVELVTAVPDSRTARELQYLKDVQSIPKCPLLIQAADEASAVGIVAGASSLGGVRAIAVIEGSGVRRSFEALSRLALGHSLFPTLLITDRGSVGESDWWAMAHKPTVSAVLESLGYAWEYVSEPCDLERTLVRMFRTAATQQCGVAAVRNYESRPFGGPK